MNERPLGPPNFLARLLVGHSISLLALITLATLLVDCGVDNPTGGEIIGAGRGALGSPDVSERLIPVRVVIPLAYDGQSDFVNYDDVRKRVQETNWAFKGAGIQFYLAKWEKLVMPHFNSVDLVSWGWPTVSAELRLAFPSLPAGAYTNETVLSEEKWLQSASGKAQDRTELVIFLAQVTNVGYSAVKPQWGSAFVIYGAGIEWKFTHELGHVFGLGHTFENPSNGPDPITGLTSQAADSWDLVYAPPNLTFASRAEALPYENDLRPKETYIDGNPYIDNCSIDQTCTVTCTIGGSPYSTGTAMLRGLAFTFAGDAPGSPHRGFNAMTYMHEPVGGATCALNGNNGVAFSNSQALQIRRHLRADVIIDRADLYNPASLGLRAGRVRLGEGRARASIYAYLAERLDLDGDGKREIGIWQPPVSPQAQGAFSFLLSTLSYDASQPLVRTFGRMGDIPAMSDYNGDGRTDIAVYRKGGATGSNPSDTYGWWDYCASPNFDCTVTTPIQWGWQTDVPLPGTNFDGNLTTGELAVYRPTDGNWYWRTVGSTTAHTISGNGGSESFGRVQLPGLYDTDELTDIVYYRPGAGVFSMLLSTTNWSQASRIDRAFPSEVVPFAYGMYDSSGAVVMRRAQAKPYICNPDCAYRPRRVLQLWAERVGMWYVSARWGASRDPQGGRVGAGAARRAEVGASRRLRRSSQMGMLLITAFPQLGRPRGAFLRTRPNPSAGVCAICG